MGHIRQLPLLELRSKYALDLAIETGTQHAEGTLELLKFFHWVYTIEIDPKRWMRAYMLLQDYPGARCLLGNSPDVLNILLNNPEKENNILFWLDAHFPFEDHNIPETSEQKRTYLPLTSELEIIRKHREKLWMEKRSKDVIIIDDARIYEEANYEMGNWKYCLKNTDHLLLFHATHEVKLDLRETGYRILTPRP